MADFFSDNIVLVFFLYGLAFYSMGLAVLLEISRSSELDFAYALKPLAGFGLVHGFHEWFEMGLINHTRQTGAIEPEWVFYLRLVLLAISFMFLLAFGARLIIGPRRKQQQQWLLGGIFTLWFFGLLLILRSPYPDRSQLIAADVYTRYALAIPGATLACWGLLVQGRMLAKSGMKQYGIDVTIAAIAFILYGAIGQLFVSPSILFPSTYLNSDLFLRWIGFPIQGFRALMAIIAAVFIIRSLRAFDEENQRRITALNNAQKEEQARLQALRAELLRRTVQAQEQERQRIARELHDETGQTLTALGLGLNALGQACSTNPQKASQMARELQELATNGLADLQNIVSGLHPPHLDELGLLPALRWYAEEMSQRSMLPIEVSGTSNGADIPEEVRLTIFRIAQEAITNTIRHAQAKKVMVNLETHAPEIKLTVEDNGQGFNVDSVLAGSEHNCLGLLGMIERARLLGGECEIHSMRGRGTIVQVNINYAKEPESSNPPAAGR
jgi:signal transduction histidine kinase